VNSKKSPRGGGLVRRSVGRFAPEVNSYIGPHDGVVRELLLSTECRARMAQRAGGTSNRAVGSFSVRRPTMPFQNDTKPKDEPAFDYDYTAWIVAGIALLFVVAIGVWTFSGPKARPIAAVPTGLTASSKTGSAASTKPSETTGQATSPSGSTTTGVKLSR
jgi:hypothetical protein